MGKHLEKLLVSEEGFLNTGRGCSVCMLLGMTQKRLGEMMM